MADITFRCVACNQQMEVDAAYEGQSANCVNCGASLVIPSAPAEESVFIACPNRECTQHLRLPKSAKRLRVRCPACNSTFRYPFESRLEVRPIRWYHKGWFVIPLLIFVTPIGIILLWNSPRYRTPVKVGLTIAFSLWFIGGYLGRDRVVHYRSLSPDDYLADVGESTTIYLDCVPDDERRVMLTGLVATISPAELPLTVRDIAERAKPAVVAIETTDAAGKKVGQGTGFVISSEGVIATCAHVLSGAAHAVVKMIDGVGLKGRLVAIDGERDIAILKIGREHLSAVPLGDSDAIAEGERIVTITNPLGFERSISEGIVSALRTDDTGRGWIQLTAPVSPGSSGGPVLTLTGVVVGIATKQMPGILGQNLNFAVPINYLKELVHEQ